MSGVKKHRFGLLVLIAQSAKLNSYSVKSRNLRALTTDAAVLDFFARVFPDALELIPGLLQNLQRRTRRRTSQST